MAGHERATTSGQGWPGTAKRYPFRRGDAPCARRRARAEIADLVRRHRGRSIAVFGSVARGEDDASSDIDFLVDFDPGSSLFDLLHLQDALTELLNLGCRVDVVSAGGLKPRDDHIRREASPL